MSAHVFTVKSDNDERVEYALDGKHLITANHDDHGWSGMEAIEKLIVAIAQQIGATVQDVDDGR